MLTIADALIVRLRSLTASIYRRPTSFYFFLFLFLSCNPGQKTNPLVNPPDLGDGIKTGILSAVEMDSTALLDLHAQLESDVYQNIHSVLILRSGALVFEKYYSGTDAKIAFGVDDTPFERAGTSNPGINPIDSLHDVRSISKSVTSACMGIAIERGMITSVDENIWTFFPEYQHLNTGLKASITIRHLLTMTSGLKVNETVPYNDPANTERLTNHSEDPLAYVLGLPAIDTPGTRWNYSGGCTELLAAIIHKVSGLEIDAFAKQFLFTPLGISHFEWIRLPDTPHRKGMPAAASGLRLTSRDLIKIGLLYLNHGTWENKQVIPATWTDSSLQLYVQTDFPDTSYGFQFWGTQTVINSQPVDVFAAMGNGGQLIVIVPSLETVIVVTAGNYGDTNLGHQSYVMIEQEIFPAIQKPKK